MSARAEETVPGAGTATSTGADWSARPEGGGRFALGALLRIALWFGRGATRLLLGPITFYCYLRRGPERRASRAYLTRLLGRPARTSEVLRHMHCFSSVLLDRAYLLGEQFKRFDVSLHGIEELVRALDLQRGVLLLGSHHGSFDALRVLSLERPDVPLRVVIDVGHNPVVTSLLHTLNPTLARSVIDAGQDGPAILLAIKEALEQKALVTLLADRPRPGETAVAARFLGDPAPFPAAPWLIAAVLKVPVVLCFGLYRGGNRYELHFELFSECIDVPRRERRTALAALVQRYADRLTHYVHLAPNNWFNFYDFWQIERAPTPHGSDAAAAVPAGDGARR